MACSGKDLELMAFVHSLRNISGTGVRCCVLLYSAPTCYVCQGLLLSRCTPLSSESSESNQCQALKEGNAQVMVEGCLLVRLSYSSTCLVVIIVIAPDP